MANLLHALGGKKPLAALLTAALLSVLLRFLSGSGSEPSMADVYSSELTPLQKHVAFFDRNKDGVIYPSETYQGFRAIGCGVALSAFSAVFINGMLGPKTVPENEKGSAFKLPIYVKNIHKGKHGSDSGVYDAHGRFVPEKFEDIFKKHAHTRPDALTGKELQEMLQANREPKDLKGRVGGFTEWKVLYSLCKDKEGLLHKETVRAVYDGSLFVKLEQERKDAKESKYHEYSLMFCSVASSAVKPEMSKQILLNHWMHQQAFSYSLHILHQITITHL